MSTATKIQCPHCGGDIDVNNVLSHQLEEQYKKKYTAELSAEKKKYELEKNKLDEQRLMLEEQRAEQQRVVDEQVAKRMNEQRVKLEKELSAKITEEQSQEIAEYKKELNDKSEKLKELMKTKAENERLVREKNELRQQLELENERKLNEQIQQERERIIKLESEKSEMQLNELKKQLEEQKKLTDEMKRKQEQGSMQLQGEVQELAIEEWLEENFPTDTIQEIKKGERGADCLQIVNTSMRQHCGTIYYESKRTKEFRPNWIEKFKQDIRDKGADIGVLVTDNYPKGMQRLGLYEGVWICSFEEFKGLSVVLRDSIIRVSDVSSSNENRGDKMVMLYDLLTGNEFRLQVEAIVEGFTEMQKDLVKEKRAIEGAWKKREKQLQKVLLNTNYMYQSIRGIAGKAIQPIQALELPEPNSMDNDEDQDQEESL